MNWSNATGLKISTTKTRVMSFHKKTAHRLQQQKFLGLIFDEQITWKSHISKLKSDCEKSINLLKILANKNYGPDRKTLRKVYHAMIRSKIDYGSMIYRVSRK